MKKMRILAAFLVLALIMTGCCLKHDWQEADCETPKTCAECGKTEGEPLGHDWQNATCETPKTCADCGKTEGAALGHTWTPATCLFPATCSVCSATEGEALGHTAGYWNISGSTMNTTCESCGTAMEEPLDWETIGWQRITDKWMSSAIAYGDADWTMGGYDDIWVEFREDGTGEFYLFQSIPGTVSYIGYEEASDVVVFRIFSDDGSYTFKLWIENDTLFIFGDGLSFAFERD